MNDLGFKHIILTRFGLGQSKDDYFRVNIEYLERLLSASLEHQTSKDFIWLIMIDVRAPDWVFERLEEIKYRVPGSDYVVHDPFESLSVAPDIKSMLEKHGASSDDYVVTTRIDSDDALSLNYITKVNACVARSLRVYGRVPISINPVDGIYYYPEHESFFSVRKDNYSVQTVGSVFNSSYIHAHSGSHKQMSSVFQARGWQAIFFASGVPMWLRSMRKDSNVHQQNGVSYGGVFHYALSRIRQLKDKIMRRSSPTLIKKMMSAGEVSDYFSINNQTQDRLLFVEKNLSVKDDAVKRASSFLKRWQYKQSIVDEYVDILESGSVAGIELERRRIELIKRYYAR